MATMHLKLSNTCAALYEYLLLNQQPYGNLSNKKNIAVINVNYSVSIQSRLTKNVHAI